MALLDVVIVLGVLGFMAVLIIARIQQQKFTEVLSEIRDFLKEGSEEVPIR